MKSEAFLQTATKALTDEIMRFGGLSYDDSTKLSTEIISTIDWENEALMHKGYAWMAKEYFRKQAA
jgi:hypothetical protein